MNTINKIISEDKTIRNNRLKENGTHLKPNEDFVLNDDENHIYIVLDGISRPNDEYEKDSETSLASQVSQIFGEMVHKYIKMYINECSNYKIAKLILRNAFFAANNTVNNFLNKRIDEFKDKERPGCVGIIAFIKNDCLYYGSFGDCMGILLRSNQRIIFAQKQTRFSFDILKQEQDRKLLMDEVVNKHHNPYGYGVVNGDPNAFNYLDISYLNLNNKDMICLVSDGISDFIQYNKNKVLYELTLDKLIEESNKQDDLIGKPYYDDKTIIRIRFE